MTESSQVKISIWRAFVPRSALIMSAAPGDDTEQPVRELAGLDSGLHTEVFTWRTSEDPLGGVVNQEARDRLAKALFGALDIHVHPQERSIVSLRSFVDAAKTVLETESVEWSESQSSSIDNGETQRLNPLLALVNHLSWLIAVFEGQPYISVSVR